MGGRDDQLAIVVCRGEGRVREQTPPHDAETEACVLGAILADNAKLLPVLEILTAESFYRERHARTFRAMVSLLETGSVIDPVTLTDRLSLRGELESAGGKAAVGELLEYGTDGYGVVHHAKIVRDYADRRALAEACAGIQSAVMSGDRSVSVRDMARELFAKVLPFTTDSDGPGFRLAKHELYAILEQIEARGTVGEQGLMTGYGAIDRETHGFRPGELVIFGGVEKSGKTAAALNVARKVCQQGIGVGIVSAEMTMPTLLERILSADSRIPSKRLQSGRMEEGDFPALARAAGNIGSYPLWVDDEAEPTLADVSARCAALKAQHPEVGLIVVDFLQLVRAHVEKGRSEASELKAVAYGLKGMAKRLNVVVLAPCQVNSKDVEDLKDARPRLKDLQGSSGMRQAADFIALVFRPGMYNDMAADNDVIELNFAACRRTASFLARLRWDGPTMSIHG